MSDQDATSSRVAIPLGTSTAAHTIKKRSRPAHGKRHRAHALQDESSSESGDEPEQAVRHKVITTYSSGGSDDEHGSKGNRRRRGGERSPQSHNGPTKGHQEGGKEGCADIQGVKPVKWGLTINMKGAGKHKDREGKPRVDNQEPKLGGPGNGKRERDLDDEALDALVGTEPPRKTKYNPSNPDREPVLEDYRAISIDDFGATLLRNFGWDGHMRGKVKEVTKHANLTGLGAKDAKGAEDLGAWNQKTSKDSRPVRLEDYQREQGKKRERLEDRHRDSYKREREREREKEREYRRDR